jgi:hypothetical protein
MRELSDAYNVPKSDVKVVKNTAKDYGLKCKLQNLTN